MGLSILHLHLHGLFRGRELELGRDSDTGGQTTYVLELARALAASSLVDRVEVLTRQIFDKRISLDYGQTTELIGPGALIRRLPFGPRRYLRKELLWPFLDHLADRLCRQLQAQSRLPHWIHAHYADAGYVGAQLRRRRGIPLVFTAHSLGREKRRLLLAAGEPERLLEPRYGFERRIAAEEMTLANSSLVVTASHQELERQYASYANFRPHRARVIPPGVDRQLFHPPRPGEAESSLEPHLSPWLARPSLPPLLAICRPDPRKNIPALVEAFAASAWLRRRHNLVLVLGSGSSSLAQQVLDQVRLHRLEGSVACPRQLDRPKIPLLYRWATRRLGVFVNPALTEPFGLTLLEATASDLPLVATRDGGPREIVARCANGLLVDVAVPGALQRCLEEALAHPLRWRRWSAQGLAAVGQHYSWEAHRSTYLAAVAPLLVSPCRVGEGGRLRGRFAVAAGVVGVGGRHPVAEVVGPVLPPRQPLGAQPGAAHGGDQLGDLQR